MLFNWTAANDALLIILHSREERKWREWVDATFVHTLSPNIYRTAAEAMQAFEYFAQRANLGFIEKYSTKYGGPIAMYFIGKHIKNKYVPYTMPIETVL